MRTVTVGHETTMKHVLHSDHLLKHHFEIGIYFAYLFYSFSINNLSLATAKAAFVLIMSACRMLKSGGLSLSGPCGRRGRRGWRLPPLSPPATMLGCLCLVPGQYRVQVTGRTFVNAVYPSQTHFPAVIGHTN